MTLFWPGDERAGSAMSDAALLAAMIETEAAWLDALITAGLAPSGAKTDLTGIVTENDVTVIAQRAEAGGNPVIPLVSLLRERLEGRDPDAAAWLHRGLTSQDVMDTALVLCSRDALLRVIDELGQQMELTAALADQHRDTAMAGRTLTQHAVPITFGVKAATWLDALLDAAEQGARTVATLPAQLGGAVGTLSAATQWASRAGSGDPPRAAVEVAGHAAATLRLIARSPWHGSRAPITAIGAALTAGTAAWGRIANDVLTLSRPEIGELAEPTNTGRGGSSAMPQKVNPILSVLIRRTALSAPAQALQLQLAAAESHDERPAGSWHIEWQALQLLGRHAVAAASQTSGLLGGLHVDAARMAANVAAAGDDILAEQRAVGAQRDRPADAGSLIVDAVIGRADAWTRGRR